jgi:hypothetical protein
VIGRWSPLQPLVLASIVGLMPWAALAQLPPQLPSLPDNPYGDCVTRYGHTGCAARLYAQLLCDNVGGAMPDTILLEQRLAEHYEQAAIDFRGITTQQVETAAVRYYAAMLCPAKSEQIRRLFMRS